MHEIRAKIPDDLYEEFMKYLSENNKTVKDSVIEALKAFLKGKQLVIESLPKCKIIITQYDTQCLFCNSEIKAGTKVIWFKGYGVVCKQCALRSLVDKYLDKDIAKQYIRTLADLERIKALKSEAQKHLKELLMKISVLEQSCKLYEIKRIVRDLAIQVKEYYEFLLSSRISKEEFFKKMDEVLSRLNEVIETIEKHEVMIPEKWRKELKIEVRA